MSRESLWVCTDCHALSTGGAEIYPDEARAVTVRTAVMALRLTGMVVAGRRRDIDDTACPCECCGTAARGPRHSVIVREVEDDPPGDEDCGF